MASKEEYEKIVKENEELKKKNARLEKQGKTMSSFITGAGYSLMGISKDFGEASDMEMQINIPESTMIEVRRAESTSVLLARRVSSAALRNTDNSTPGSPALTRRDSNGNVNAARLESNVSIGTVGMRVAIQRRNSASILPGASVAAPVARPTLKELKAELDAQPKAMKYTEHMFDLPRLSGFFSSHIDPDDVKASRGLTSDQALFMLKEFGPNELTPPPRVPMWMLFLLQFVNIFMLILIAAGLLSIITFIINPSDPSNLYLGLLLLVVVFVTCYETFSQEAKSDALMETFRSMVPDAAAVIRNGNLSPLKAKDLVVGDIVKLKSGDKVPADCRIILNESMKIDQAMITGESESVESSVACCDPDPLEARNIIFNGSLVVDGGCLAVVIRTGDETLMGSMVELTGDTGKAKTTLKADVEHFVLVLTVYALIQAVAIFVVGWARGIPPIDAFIQGFIVIMIANVPQGLPSSITAALFIVAERMGKQNVFVKKLDIIETLGSCSVICTDKTGTLTQNLMSVANLWVFGSKISAADAISSSKNASLLQQLANVSCLNSRVAIECSSSGESKPVGDATELGLYRFGTDMVKTLYNTPIEDFRLKNKKIFEIPFNSTNKWQMSVHKMAPSTDGDSSQAEEVCLLLKGAPDVLMSKCGFYLGQNGEKCPVDDAFKDIYTKAYEEFGGHGERVLGFAMKSLTGIDESLFKGDAHGKDFIEQLKADLVGKNDTPTCDLTFVGLITLIDPPRVEVPQAIEECKTAGVKVVMVTGDHPLTAAAIAKKIGLITTPSRADIAAERGVDVSEVGEHEVEHLVIHGNMIADMTDDDWTRLILKKEVVFARTSPEQKLIIVNKFTEAGNIVAMTGDGVNDSPALKQAAIGVAMGLNGSDVAREAADIVLLDDNFASIVIGIREGRLLFVNLKKTIAYTLTHLSPEVVPVLLWAFVGFPQAMGGMLTLCIDLLTELLPSMSLSFERSENGIMSVPPRNPKTDRLVSIPMLLYSYFQAGFIETGICFFVLFRVYDFYGVSARDYATLDSLKYFNSDPDGDYISSNGNVLSPSDQKHVLAIVQASWFLTIVVCQIVHVFACRTNIMSLFTHGFFANKYTNYGTVVALCLGLIVVYTPGVQTIVASYNPHSLTILYAALIAIASILGFTETRKFFIRNYPGSYIVKKLIAL